MLSAHLEAGVGVGDAENQDRDDKSRWTKALVTCAKSRAPVLDVQIARELGLSDPSCRFTF